MRLRIAPFIRKGTLLLVGVVGVSTICNADSWTVRHGDTLSELAAKHFGRPIFGDSGSLNKLLQLNPNIQNPNLIRVGESLQLPTAPEVVTPPVAAETPEAPVTPLRPEPSGPVESADAGALEVSPSGGVDNLFYKSSGGFGSSSATKAGAYLGLGAAYTRRDWRYDLGAQVSRFKLEQTLFEANPMPAVTRRSHRLRAGVSYRGFLAAIRHESLNEAYAQSDRANWKLANVLGVSAGYRQQFLIAESLEFVGAAELAYFAKGFSMGSDALALKSASVFGARLRAAANYLLTSQFSVGLMTEANFRKGHFVGSFVTTEARSDFRILSLSVGALATFKF